MNVCTFSGRLARDAESRYTQSGKNVASFSIAVDFGFGQNKGTAFIDCTKWNCEKLVPYLTKGKAVIVSGEMQQDSWQDNNGNNRTKLKLNVQNFDFQTGDKQQQGNNRQQGNGGYQQNDSGPKFPSEASGLENVPF